MKEVIETKDAPRPVGPYNQAIRIENTLYLSGQVALEPKTGALVDGGVEEQTRRVCENIKAVLAAAGANFEDVVKTTCYLATMADFESFNTVYAAYFTSKPARSCVEVSALPKGARVEVEVIAVTKQ